MEFDFDIIHKPCRDKVADYFSRNIKKITSKDNISENKNSKVAEEFVNLIDAYTKPSAMKIEKLNNKENKPEELKMTEFPKHGKN